MSIDEKRVRRVLDGLKRCRRGDTYARCETECFYGKNHKYDCQKWLMGDAIGLIISLLKTATKGKWEDKEDED